MIPPQGVNGNGELTRLGQHTSIVLPTVQIIIS